MNEKLEMSLVSVSFTIFLLLVFPSPTTPSDYTKLVYNGCSVEKFQDPNGVYSQSLKTLYSSLLSASSQKPFSNSTAGNAVTGLYQCRGDLTTSQCSDCVSKIPDIVSKLCDKAAAARVQLHGCYLRYEVVGFKEASETQVLYKTCGPITAQGSGFSERRERAFGMVEEGVKNGGSLFYTGSLESVYVLGQCEGDLSGDECGRCVKNGFESVESVCGYSISGQVYLQKCYVSYSYYPNGVPGISSTSPGKGTSGQNHTQRTVAVAVGGVAALGFLVVCLLFVRSVVKKRGGNKY